MDETIAKRIDQIWASRRPLDADALFEDLNVVPGRVWSVPSGRAINPYEHLKTYESRLEEIYNWDREKYFYIHKGLPFYFCGILSFDIGAYDRAVFYFDAALSEDLKNKPRIYNQFAAYALYALDQAYSNVIVTYPVNILRTKLEALITEYNQLFTGNSLTLDFIIKNFLKKNLSAPRKTMLSSLVKVRPEERLATTSELNPASSLVTGW